MFKEGNKELLRPDEQGEFFFDRNPFVFQVFGLIFLYISISQSLPFSIASSFPQQQTERLSSSVSHICGKVVLDFYRTGRLHIPPTVSHDMVKEEFDFFQIKLSNEDLISEKLGTFLFLRYETQNLSVLSERQLGDRMKRLSLRQAYANHRPVLDRLLQLVFEIVSKAAEEGCRFCSIGSPNA